MRKLTENMRRLLLTLVSHHLHHILKRHKYPPMLNLVYLLPTEFLMAEITQALRRITDEQSKQVSEKIIEF